jgi:hypothetical protein
MPFVNDHEFAMMDGVLPVQAHGDATGVVFGNIGIGGAVAIMLILGSAIALLIWKMFELTTAMPDRIIRWVGQLPAPLDDEAGGLTREAQSARLLPFNQVSISTYYIDIICLNCKNMSYEIP